ncbi:non-ribosomal peptide synthetase [Virgisporangium aurantiacum]|uniref:Amino acid adenylation protein n=1 Tax=Virgisporangium aurantiacum TaxID=175570 RepID=A0A8J4DYE2_9ACTN|nr:amino acid adenylation domain-containing protein [Virgisporangium aurantiacum]GIJ54819.1 amino acid adenylation protein [Virgisporangium aurantiacum]
MTDSATPVPRWTAHGAGGTGFARLDSTVAAPVVDRIVDVYGPDLRGPLLAAHAAVVAALASTPRVVTGVRDLDGTVRTRALTVNAGGWPTLVVAASRPTATAGGPPPETVLDLGSPCAEPDPATVLHVSLTPAGDGLALCLRYRRDAVDDSWAARVAGYLHAALDALTGTGSPRDAGSLIGADERHALLHMGGPVRDLPDRRFTEIFEELTVEHPDAVAAIHNGQRWTYRTLNARANQIAHALLRRGIRAEDPVAVVMDRTLDWLAATIGVLKAGGVYLPVRPDFPPDRVATQLTRSGCRFAVTEPRSAPTLRATVERACATVTVAEAYASDSVGDPAVPVGPDQLAYIYFTSGSTGAPKGAMCEHAGMLNHLYMKVEDMRLGPGDVVTQTASQCFDISLWQLLAPLLVGGATRIVDTDTQLDVGKFLDLLAAGGVQVIQIVPAYLDVLLSTVERDPRALGDLRSVSVTGEALRFELVRRWFATYPDIPLVNAYGATEVSDDTMHAILDRAPERGFVSVGRTLRNVDTYILDEHLRLVPTGAPGEIVFSGVCVGRGYINDPERTAAAFVEDPFRPGTRLYRTGDFGRWLPEGTIEFLGRRDEQVKVRGYRIELGEIESRLLRMPGVGQVAVVITGSDEQSRNLVAFCTGPDTPQPADMRDFVAAAVPEYMVPSYFHRLDELPLTENGKVDKRRLMALAETLGQGAAAFVPPATGAERRLATAWAEVLNVPVGRIGRDDSFFRLGGTSLAAVRLVVKLDRRVSLRQLVSTPVLRDLAGLVESADAPDGSASSLLQPLSTPDLDPVATLVCFPYAGGNAVNFQQLARALEPSRIAVSGVELPGHDIAGTDGDLADVAAIAERVDRELAGVSGPVLLWGHCAGAAFALAVARRMEDRGAAPAGLVLGAMLLDEPAVLDAENAAVSAMSNAEITAQLHRDSAYIELDLLRSERADVVGAAYRHDVCTTNAYLRNAVPARLATPVDVVVAADDPSTSGYAERYGRWRLLADTVRLHEVAEGGHYFVRTRAAEAAAVAVAVLETVTAAVR